MHVEQIIGNSPLSFPQVLNAWCADQGMNQPQSVKQSVWISNIVKHVYFTCQCEADESCTF